MKRADLAPIRMLSVLVAILLVSRGSGGPPAAVAAEIPCAEHSDARLGDMTDEGILLTSTLGLASGRFALPASAAPTQLVVMFHGHLNDSCSWRNHLRRAAAKGAVAVAMDYVRQEPVENYGWSIRQAAAESIAAAKHFLAAYPTITRVVAYGISMGGNASGVAVASPEAVRADGSPLFNYWVSVEGVSNLIEFYLTYRVVALVNADAALPLRAIEDENGGTLEAVPERYAEITNLYRTPDMTGLEGAVIVHGLDDGLVSADQSPLMAVALNAAGVPTHLYNVVLKGEAESGTTATSIALGPVFGAVGLAYESPLAGHGWEGSDTQLVIKTGFEQLDRLLDGHVVAPGVTLVPGA